VDEKFNHKIKKPPGGDPGDRKNISLGESADLEEVHGWKRDICVNYSEIQ
jgi:hypothetical protein